MEWVAALARYCSEQVLRRASDGFSSAWAGEISDGNTANATPPARVIVFDAGFSGGLIVGGATAGASDTGGAAGAATTGGGLRQDRRLSFWRVTFADLILVANTRLVAPVNHRLVALCPRRD